MDWVSGCVFSHVPPLGRALIHSPVGDLDYYPVVFQASVFSHSSPVCLLTSVSIGCFRSPCLLFSCCSSCFPCAHSISSDSSYSPFAVPSAYLDTGLIGDSVRWLCFWFTPLTCLPSCRHNARSLYISGWTTGSPAAIQYAHLA